MDSGNTSGSLQSSSGDDQEFDSRAESSSISAFLINSNTGNNPSSSHVGPLQSSAMFDPLSNYFVDNNPLSRTPQLANHPNSLLNLDTIWSKTLRSEPNCTDLGGFMAPSPSPSPTQQFLTQSSINRPSFGSSMQFPQGPENNVATTKGSVSVSLSGSVSMAGTSDHHQQTNNSGHSNSTIGVRNPKKRSRASRRAPTTVLTTDTTNFRAMVQEFTGIPAQPFTSSPFPRSRLDLFGAAASTLRSNNLDPSPTPPYLLRPFAQKIHPPTPTPTLNPFVSSSSSSLSNSSSFLNSSSSSIVDAIASTTTTNITSSTNNNSTSVNYQLPQNLLNINMQNPVLNFQPLLQSTPPNKYPVLGTKTQGSSLDIPSSDQSHHLKMGVLEDQFGLSHGRVSTNLGGGLQNIVSSSQETTLLARSDSSGHPANWAGDGLGSNEGDLLRSINGSYSNSSLKVTTNGKVNINFSSASSSDFRGDKGPENVPAAAVAATRSEGMVESWICSSD